MIGGWELSLAPLGKFIYTVEACRLRGIAADHRCTIDETIAFYTADAQLSIRSALRAAMRDGTGWDLELPAVDACGREVWVRTVGEADMEGGVPIGLFGAIQDITYQVQERLALESAHERLALATDGGGIGVWDLDMVSQTVVWDSWMNRLYGLMDHVGLLTCEDWLQRVHLDDRAAVKLALRASFEKGLRFLMEFSVVWRDGSVHYRRAKGDVRCDSEGRPVRLVGASWDVTSLRGLAADLSAQHELMRVTLASIGDAVVTTDASGAVTWFNPTTERMSGWASSESVGLPIAQVLRTIGRGTRRRSKENTVTACLRQGRVVHTAEDTLLILREWQEFGIRGAASPISGKRGELLGAVLVFHDVTEERRLNDELTYLATHDMLTGLVNRSEFERRLGRTLEHARQTHSKHALLFLNVDQFKVVNDACGHSVGDLWLQEITKVLAASVRSRDTLARLGGDEFAMILEHCTAEQSQLAADKICERMNDPRFEHKGQRFRLGVSIGLVPLDERWTMPAVAMQAAGMASHAAKESGRNRVHAWFDSDQNMPTRRNEMRWVSRLEQALDEGRFALFAQRIQPLQTDTPAIHAEVLLRMIDDDGSLIPPSAFLPAAERFRMCDRIDRWVLQHAIALLVSLPDITAVEMLCINLSGQSVGDRTFHVHVLAALARAGPEICRRICLEITETAAITKLVDASTFVEKVRALGVQVALDDFGAGSSSFGYLKTLKLDVLKIDGRFVRNMLDDPLDRAAVRCFVDAAKVTGLKTVAEFVDRPEVFDRLREIGVDFAQGFLVHRPEPIDCVLGHCTDEPAARLIGH